MSDLIRREDALDAINHICPIDTEYDCALLDRADVRCVLSDLPSAEPEQIIKIGRRSGKTLESAIDYLHSVGWLQEHDRILTESAEPERKKGEWVDYDAEDINDYPIEAWQSCRCTSCGKWHTTPYKYNFDQYPFCPNCGAEMTRGGR